LRKTYEIGPFRLDAAAGVLTYAGTALMLGARAVAVLTVLVERTHEFVSKRDLIDAAWPGVIVEESNLAVQVHAIRRALGKAPGGDRWIETLVKRGYRFVGPVNVSTDDAADEHRPDPKSNLAEPLTSFVGRERDLVEIKRLLPTNRLITIVGIGGIGKTRVALQAAAEVIGAYRDGAWFVDLSSARDGALVPTAVAQALGVKERGNASLVDALCAHLRPLQLLLILDNCEHLLGACADLVDAVRKSAAQVTIVATSREPLRVAGEQVYPLQPLSLPEPGGAFTLVQRSEAVRLLVDRLRQQLPDFELTAALAPAVADLCIHLDGIPLALELAAARARSLSIGEINARLGDRFRLLTSGARTALPRQQTLRATLDWSFELLTEGERVVLRRLGVFPGSFTVDAACAIVNDVRIDEFAVADAMSQLVERSLLIADTGAGAVRYRLLETTRAYAREKLAEAAETSVIARRHAEYFSNRFLRAPDDFLRLPDATLREMYSADLDDVRSALDASFDAAGDAATGIRLAGNSGPLWGMLGLFTEGARRLETALARLRTDTPASDEALLSRQLGRLMDEAPARARPAFERAAALYRNIGDRMGLAHSLVHLGRALAYLGEFDAGEAAFDEANALLADTEFPWLRGLYHFNLAFLKGRRGDLAGAHDAYERSRTLFIEAGDEFTATVARANTANYLWALGDLDAAASAFREDAALLRASPMKTNRMLGWLLASHAGVLIDQGRLAEALEAGREGLPLLSEDGTAWTFLSHFALRAALAGRLSDAARLAGYWDHAWASMEMKPNRMEEGTRERLKSILDRELPVDEHERLRLEGARLTELEACRLALKD